MVSATLAGVSDEANPPAPQSGPHDLTGSGAEPLHDRDPRVIGGFPLVGRLGAGGMGRVYLGVVHGRWAAVKQMLASVVAEDQGFVRRFGHELDNIARLPAGATAPLLAGDRDGDPPWFATEYVPGITLAEAVERHGGPLDGPGLWSLLREAAAGLAAVHALDMVHRDLKPSNVMLTATGVTLIDFGIARAAEQSRLTRTGLVVGTPAYMSPEQASGKQRLTGASDVFALGLLIAFAACGQWPYGDGEGSPLYRIVHDRPDLEAVRVRDHGLAELVATCLDKDPEGRPTAAELLELTADRATSGSPVWPALVRGALAERRAFAARTPSGGGGSGADSGGSGEGVRAPRRPLRRRTRVLLAVVPVVVVIAGTTLAIRNLPYDAGDDHAAGGSPAPRVSAPAPSAASPSGTSARASKKPRKTEKADKANEANEADKAADAEEAARSAAPDQAAHARQSKAAEAPAAGGQGGGASAGSGTAAPGGTGGTGGTGGSQGGAGSGSDGGSGSGGSAPPTSGSYQLRNASTGTCMVRTSGPSVGMGSCSAADATWKLLSNGGSFMLHNAATDMCLTNAYDGQNVTVAGCSGLGIVWNWGSGGSLLSTKTGGCLTPGGFAGGVTTASCDDASSQHWTRL